MSYPIEIQHLTRYYGEHRGIIDVSFDVEEGEIFGFLGPNGAGKTTTIRHLMGILKPTSGRATIFGHDCWEERVAVKEYVGYLPSDARFYRQMTGRQTLEFFAGFRSRPTPGKRIEDLADLLELDLDRKVGQLSSGNRQKIGIIQAFMHEAPLLILDEPTAGLDPLKQQQFQSLVEAERDHGRTVFLSSHDLPEVERIAERVAIIRGGEVVAVEKMSDLKQRRQRQMDVVLSKQCSLEKLRSLEAVEITSSGDSGLHLELTISGPIQPLLQVLGELPVQDITYGPPNLESIFMHYYGEEEAELKATEKVAL